MGSTKWLMQAVALAILVACGCSTGTISAKDTTVNEPAQAARPSSTTGTVASTTAEAAEPGKGLDDPLAVGASFSSQSPQVDWDGKILGLIPTNLSEFNDEDGTCYLILGVLTPTKLSEGTVTNGFMTPEVSVLANGRRIEPEASVCDRGPAENAGYGWRLNAEVAVGTSFPFFEEIFIRESLPSEVEAIVIGRPSTAEALFYRAVILPEVPSAGVASSGQANDLDITAVGVKFNFEDSLAAWDGKILGLVRTDVSDYNDEEGTCYLILGVLTPTKLTEGLVTNGFMTPQVSVLAEGRQIQPEASACDRRPAESAGYGWRLNAEVTVGTPFPFFEEIFLQATPPPEIEAIIVGQPSTSEALYYEPKILSVAPAA